jgi:hypothetical protein
MRTGGLPLERQHILQWDRVELDRHDFEVDVHDLAP